MKSKTRISFENGLKIGRMEALAEVEKKVDKYLKGFKKLIEKRRGEPVVMAGLNNKFCAIKEYWDIENELKQELQKLKEKKE